MGVIKQGILGGFSGKVAGVVGSSWKGIAVIKARPLSVANPQTAAQTGQRSKFGAAVALATAILSEIVKPLWDRFAQLKSGYNAFISANIDNFDTSGDPTYADIVISQGSLLGEAIDSVSASNGDDEVTVNWNSSAGSGNALATDVAYVVVWNETTGSIGKTGPGNARSVNDTVVEMPENCTTGDVLHIYLAFRRADGTLVSNTAYATETV